MEKPKLRPIEILPVDYKGEQVFHLHDPQGIGDSVVLSPTAAHIAFHFFNGAYSLPDVQGVIAEKTGSILPLKDLEDLSNSLDNAGLLESDTFLTRFNKLKSDYEESDVRLPVNAGAAYPARAEQLTHYCTEMINTAKKQGAGPREGLRAIAAPHIDFQRGAVGYGFAYAALETLTPPETVIVLGVGHQVQHDAFILTDKDFATPFGAVPVNKELVHKLDAVCNGQLLTNQYEHQNEHSVEFQAVFLRYLFGPSFSIVPVLCGAFPPPVPGYEEPRGSAEVAPFLNALKDEIKQAGTRCFVVAGVDFSHVGPRFGAREPVGGMLLDGVERSDRELLDHIIEGDAAGFYETLSRDSNRYSVCGYGALYTLLNVMPELRGELLHYGQAVSPDRSQAVSFAAVGFTEA